jgi:hypothetical protein
MIEWLTEHNAGFGALANIGMLIVWLVYLQLFARGYRRQTRPKIVITRAAGSTLDASCFISNMSSDAIYIESIVASLCCGDQKWSRTVTDLETLDNEDDARDPFRKTHQGPLRPGEYMQVGTFGNLLERVLGTSANERDGLNGLQDPLVAEITVIADYASEDLLVGASRRFALHKRAHSWLLHPESVSTHQIRSRRERRKIATALDDAA